jgi:hypothetical protein
MGRRNLLQSLAALPLTVFTLGGKQVQAAEIHPGKRYVIFADMNSVYPEALTGMQLEDSHPLAGAPVIMLQVPHDKSIEDVLAIYELPTSVAPEKAA